MPQSWSETPGLERGAAVQTGLGWAPGALSPLPRGSALACRRLSVASGLSKASLIVRPMLTGESAPTAIRVIVLFKRNQTSLQGLRESSSGSIPRGLPAAVPAVTVATPPGLVEGERGGREVGVGKGKAPAGRWGALNLPPASTGAALPARLHPQTASPWRLTATPAQTPRGGRFPREMNLGSLLPRPPRQLRPSSQAPQLLPVDSTHSGDLERSWGPASRTVGKGEEPGGTRGTLGTRWTLCHHLAGWTLG